MVAPRLRCLPLVSLCRPLMAPSPWSCDCRRQTLMPSKPSLPLYPASQADPLPDPADPRLTSPLLCLVVAGVLLSSPCFLCIGLLWEGDARSTAH